MPSLATPRAKPRSVAVRPRATANQKDSGTGARSKFWKTAVAQIQHTTCRFDLQEKSENNYTPMIKSPISPLDRIKSYAQGVRDGKYPAGGMLDRLMYFDAVCFDGGWLIRDVNAAIVDFHPREPQLEILACMMDQAAQGLPIRINILKDRKRGISTFVQLLFDHLCSHYENQVAATVAHESTATEEIFAIAKLAAENFPVPFLIKAREIEWPANRSRYHCQTAGATAVGAGGNPSLLHLSEIPKWDQNKEETHTNCVNAVPSTDTSIIVKEATGKGRELFFEQWDAGSDPSNPYISLFFPWFYPPCPLIEAGEDFLPTEEEKSLIGLAHSQGYELTYGNLAWRRAKIVEIGDVEFKREYPSCPEDAIASHSGLILPGMRNCVVDEFPYDMALVAPQDRVGGIDHGYHDATVIWSGAFIDQVLWLTSYYRRAEGLAHEHCEGLAPWTTYYCDPSGVSDRKQLADAARKAEKHCQFLQAPRSKNPGEDFNTVELRQIVRLAEQGRLRILRAISKQLLIECDSYVWNEVTGKPDETRSLQCGHYDSIHALKYLCMGVLPKIGRAKAVEREHIPSRRQQMLEV